MRSRRSALAAVGICALATGVTALGTPPAHATAPSTGKLEILLDASGSMAEPAGDGHTKIQDARQALDTMVDGMQDSMQVGMRVYGATAPPGKDTRQACSDSQQVVPVSALDRAALKSAIRRYSPKGQTPTAYALQQAAKDLGDTGQRSIVLVSDGESTCSPDPCDTAKALAAKGIDLRVDVIGFKVGTKARSQLSCIAAATGGKYFPASDANGLTQALDTAKTRAAQQFSVAGTPVTGTPTSSGAPQIEAGHWTDTVPADGKTAKYYRLRHTMPGSDFLIGVTSRPKVTNSQLRLTVTTPDGTTCGSIWPDAIGFGTSSRDLLSGVLSTAPTYDWKKACSTNDLILKVEQTDWGDDAAGTPMQLNVIETPRPVNATVLQGNPKPGTTWADMPVQDAHRSAAGGSGLATATRLTPGTTSIELVPGELKFFKVPATWGQQVQALATAEQNPAYQSPGLRDFTVSILSPAGGDATMSSPNGMPESDSGTMQHQTFIDDDGARIGAVTAPIRLANRTSYSDTMVGASVAGDYYVVVGLSTTSTGPDTLRTPLKVSLQVATPQTATSQVPQFASGQEVKGVGTAGVSAESAESAGDAGTGSTAPSGSPRSSRSSASGKSAVNAAGVPAASSSSGTNWTTIGILGGSAAALLAVAAAAAIALRRRG